LGLGGLVQGLGIVTIVCAIAPTCGFARGQTQGALRQRLAAALAVPGLAAGREGALAVDLANGRTVFSFNGMRPLQPASNEKPAITFAALRRLGLDYRFRTDVLGVGRRLVRPGTATSTCKYTATRHCTRAG
jgi:D-alanyl-D-alanine carboxypeptidase